MIRFPPKDESGRDKSYDKNLNALSADSAGNKFCPQFSHVYGFGLDFATRDFTGWTGRTYASADAIVDMRWDSSVQETDRAVYFIEFKNRQLDDLDTQGTPKATDPKMRNEERIGVELRKKGMDSILVSAATLFKNEPIDDICERAEFIVVYNDRKYVACETRNVKSLDRDFALLAKQVDAYHLPVRWGLECLLQRGLYRSVHTWSIGEFEDNMRMVLK